MSERSGTLGFQYSRPRYQADTALSGMWLFLASEVLFFGTLFLAWIFCRHWDQPGFDAGARRTDLALGTLNTVLLVSSSLAYSVGAAYLEVGNRRRLMQYCGVAAALAVAFMVVKFGIEWPSDFRQHLFPDARFAIGGALGGGARLFFTFYFIGTALHGVHMLVGLVLVGWILWRARTGAFSPRYDTPVVAVGLYWSFVDLVWIVLYPLIYLIGRGP